MAGAVVGVKLPKKSLDDILKEEIYSDPQLRHQWASAHLEQMKRGGRSELDIVGEGLDLLLRLAKAMNQDSWQRVVGSAVASGEVRQTLIEMTSIFKGDSPQPSIGQPNVKSNSPSLPDHTPIAPVPPPSGDQPIRHLAPETAPPQNSSGPQPPNGGSNAAS